MNSESLALLPPKIDLETRTILKRVNNANRELAILKGFARTIPSQYVLINALSLQEAKDSSEIESIITTNDELYRAGLQEHSTISPQVKEVINYSEALHAGYKLVQKGELLTINNICIIQKILENNDAGIRKQEGTTLKNAVTGEIVYTPPQEYDTILKLMHNFEEIVNDDSVWPEIDPLIKMAVLHYQFESIHPFYDGNGRTGRILNVLYLVLKNLLDMPILYLSRYIISHKSDYYRYLQQVRTSGDWESFILFMLDAIIVTAQMTTHTIQQIDQAMQITKRQIKENFSFYRPDLVEALFLYPYTRIQHLQKQLNVSRNTATSYLNQLQKSDILDKVTIGRNHYFINKALLRILSEIPSDIDQTVPKIITDDSTLKSKNTQI